MPNEKGFFFDLAKRARDNGWRKLIPLVPRTKECHYRDWGRWRHTEATDEEIRGWCLKAPLLGFGYAHDGTLCVLDCDFEEEAKTLEAIAWLIREVGSDQFALRVEQWPHAQLYFRAGEGCFDRTKKPGCYHAEKQTVLFGLHPKTMLPFEWHGISPAASPIDRLVVLHGNVQAAFIERFGETRNISGKGSKGQEIRDLLHDYASIVKKPVDTLEEMAAVVAWPNARGRHPTCQLMAGYALHYGNSPEAIFDAFADAYLSHFRPYEHHIRLRDACRL
jgi:hypothetical protein